MVEKRIAVDRVAEAADLASVGDARVLHGAAAGRDDAMTIQVAGIASRIEFGADVEMPANGASTVVLVLEGVGREPFAGRLIGGAYAAVRRHGAVLLMVPTGGHGDLALSSRVLSDTFDGVVHAATTTAEVEPLAALNGRPLVLLNAVTRQRETVSVLPDDIQGGRMAADLLRRLGHRRIALIDAFDGGFVSRRREIGVRDGLSRDEATRSAVMKVVAGADSRGGYSATLLALTQAEPATAIVCVSDRMAMGAYRAAAELGLSVPDDVSIVAFGEADPVASGLFPALTTVEPPLFEMGEYAAEALLALLSAQVDDLRRIVELEYTLVDRGSVAAPRGWV